MATSPTSTRRAPTLRWCSRSISRMPAGRSCSTTPSTSILKGTPSTITSSSTSRPQVLGPASPNPAEYPARGCSSVGRSTSMTHAAGSASAIHFHSHSRATVRSSYASAYSRTASPVLATVAPPSILLKACSSTTSRLSPAQAPINALTSTTTSPMPRRAIRCMPAAVSRLTSGSTTRIWAWTAHPTHGTRSRTRRSCPLDGP